MKQRITLLLALFLTPSVQAQNSQNDTPQIKRPNIVVILADDLGFSDIQPFGSEISTPNLNNLAAQGLRFSNYHTAASCAPTRAMLMTGVDSHLAGVGNIAEALTPAHQGSPNYRGSLNHNVVTIASLLKDAKYHTYMAGKWHLGYKDKAHRPINRGFEQTTMMPFSGGDNWSNKAYQPNYKTTLWFENGEPLTLPDDFYSSKFIVDKSIKSIDSSIQDGQPFFSYLAFQAVHIPVQAPKEFTDKYTDTYSQGWSALRESRQKSVKELGLIPADAPMKRMNTTHDWDALSDDEKRFRAKSMAVYAGMVDAMDFHIGRLINYLKAIGEYDNTVFIFTSDNGAEPSDPDNVSKVFGYWLKLTGYNRDYATLGEKGSYSYIGTSFASAASSPLGHYKFHAGEGGMRVPLIIAGPGLANGHQGNISNAMAYVKDLAPTILDIATVRPPNQPGLIAAVSTSDYKGKQVLNMTGKSLMPLINASQTEIHAKDEPIAYEIGGNAALIKGDYKIVYNRGDNNDPKWHLYNIAKDPGETQMLEERLPDVTADLLRDYQQYVQDNGVLAVPDGYEQRRQVIKNAIQTRIVEPIKNMFSF